MRLTLSLAITIFYLMSMWAYLCTVFTSNHSIQPSTTNMSNSTTYQLLPLRNADKCVKCADAFKPRRTGHCS